MSGTPVVNHQLFSAAVAEKGQYMYGYIFIYCLAEPNTFIKTSKHDIPFGFMRLIIQSNKMGGNARRSSRFVDFWPTISSTVVWYYRRFKYY